ncbi:MAG: glycosyltransferase [Candidatus Colwellbacteria bacterium]|nr:glycosyltransferase [Candidatus Colwellbacteria bacterium]
MVKVALVHDYLNQFGGAERVLFVLAEMFPEAPIYTLFYEPSVFDGHLKGGTIKTSFLDHAIVRRRHRFFIPLFPKAAENLNLGNNYDLIISNSSGFAKGINYKGGVHLSYIHTPLRYAWEPETWLGTLLPKVVIKLSSPIISYLRRWDRRAGKKPDFIITLSTHIAKKIKEAYGREAEVIYPPVDTTVFYPDYSVPKQDYFLAFGRLIHNKRFDLVIEAFNELQFPLKIVGSGPHEAKLKKLAHSNNIEFLARISDDELRKVITGAKAFIFPQLEDFGLVAAEALACGTPVIAYRAGGALDIIEEDANGLFFDEQTPNSLIEAINRFNKMKFDQEKIVQSAQKFSEALFRQNLTRVINQSFTLPL